MDKGGRGVPRPHTGQTTQQTTTTADLIKNELDTSRRLNHADFSMLVHCHHHHAVRHQLFFLSWINQHELATVEERKCDTNRNVNDTEWQWIPTHVTHNHCCQRSCYYHTDHIRSVSIESCDTADRQTSTTMSGSGSLHM